jgi:hypothetical protein
VENESLNVSWAVVLGRLLLLVCENLVDDGTVDMALAGAGLNNDVMLALSASCMTTSLGIALALLLVNVVVLFSDRRPRDAPFLVAEDGLKKEVQLEWKASCMASLVDDAFALAATTAETDRWLPFGFGLRNENCMVCCLSWWCFFSGLTKVLVCF